MEIVVEQGIFCFVMLEIDMGADILDRGNNCYNGVVFSWINETLGYALDYFFGIGFNIPFNPFLVISGRCLLILRNIIINAPRARYEYIYHLSLLTL